MHGMARQGERRGRGCVSRARALRYHSSMRLFFRPFVIASLMTLACAAHGVESESTNTEAVDVVEDAGAAARQAVGMTGGRVLDVQKRFFGERAMYVVKVLLGDGRVKTVEVEANPISAPDFMER